MASIEPKLEKHVDTPLSNFPMGIDNFDRMQDVTSALMPLVVQYNTYFAAGNNTACNNLIASNPLLNNCFVNANRLNQLRDGLIAAQRFLLEDVDEFIKYIAQQTVGINDDPTDEEAEVVAYSASKINKLHKQRKLTLLAANWSNSYPYTQTVVVEDVTANDKLKVIGIYHASGNTFDQDKAIDKAAGFLMSNDDGVGDGQIVFKAKKKPTIDFTVITEGG